MLMLRGSELIGFVLKQGGHNLDIFNAPSVLFIQHTYKTEVEINFPIMAGETTNYYFR